MGRDVNMLVSLFQRYKTANKWKHEQIMIMRLIGLKLSTVKKNGIKQWHPSFIIALAERCLCPK